jgi:hypothetical protein
MKGLTISHSLFFTVHRGDACLEIMVTGNGRALERGGIASDLRGFLYVDCKRRLGDCVCRCVISRGESALEEVRGELDGRRASSVCGMCGVVSIGADDD